MRKIAHQGGKGSFSHLNSVKLFGEDQVYIGYFKFEKIFEAVLAKEAEYGVIPLENSLAGSIYENYDNLWRYPLQIEAESYLHVEHFLWGMGKLDAVRRVYSHPKALEQCRLFFESHPGLERIPTTDTASAAEYAFKSGNGDCAAIASKAAGDFFGLNLLQGNIEDDSSNYTRFVTIGMPQQTGTNYTKCSLILILEHSPGALHRVLSICAVYNVNLTKIESRPLIGSPFEYVFYLDFTSPDLPKIMHDLIPDLEKAVRKIKVIGRYQKEAVA